MNPKIQTCTTKKCSAQAEYYCFSHSYITCLRCCRSRHYDCEYDRICDSDELNETMKFLTDFEQGLQQLAHKYDMLQTINGLEQALADIASAVQEFQAEVSECLTFGNIRELSMLVSRGKQILPDIFKGSLFTSQNEYNPILKLLFDSQVLDTLGGNLLPFVIKDADLINRKTVKIVRNLRLRTKNYYEQTRRKEIREVRKEATKKAWDEATVKTEKKMNRRFQLKIESLERQILELKKDKEQAESLVSDLIIQLDHKNEVGGQSRDFDQEFPNRIEMPQVLTPIKDPENCVKYRGSLVQPDDGVFCLNLTEEKEPKAVHYASRTSSARSIADSTFKVVFIGDTVGKTQLATRMKTGTFKNNLSYLVGLDMFKVTRDFQDRKVTIMVYDAPAQERFRAVTLNYIKQCQYTFLMYDITDLNSLKTCRYWAGSLKSPAETTYLVGTKADLASKTAITSVQISEFQAMNNIDFHFETSAKTGEGVEELLQHVMGRFHNVEPFSPKKERPSYSKPKGLLKRIFGK
ncbi:unnamed protein product [Moneuplotes crassus]|uniref:Uncharacterized protein n=1 Tax=Euplotes crassus TaxID=5936 RepID=A0AAD1U4R6_EUPCR|nr:unnamed protein product [Moneuplotes crassus]